MKYLLTVLAVVYIGMALMGLVGMVAERVTGRTGSDL